MKRTHHMMQHEDATVDTKNTEHAAGEKDEASDDGVILPYDASREETLPESPVYTEDFRKIKIDIKAIADLLLSPIRETTYRDAVIEGLIEEVTQRTRGGFPENVCIALIGEMAAGGCPCDRMATWFFD